MKSVKLPAVYLLLPLVTFFFSFQGCSSPQPQVFLYVIKENGKYGYIDKTGEIIIPPKYDDAMPFSDGLARVMVNDHGYSRWGFINSKGEFVIKPELFAAKDFKEGLAPILAGDNKWGYTAPNDTTGYAIGPQFDDASEFFDEMARVRVGSNWGYINKQGRLKLPPIYQQAGNFSHGLARVEQNGQWGFVNDDGKIMISEIYSEAGDFCEGLARVRQNAKWGYISKDGGYVIQPQFQLAGDFSEGLAKISFESAPPRWGYIDKHGNIVINPQFTEARNFSENLALVGDKWLGFINHDGKWIIPAQFGQESGSFRGGIAPVSLGWSMKPGGNVLDGIHYIDKTGRFVWKAKINN